VDSIHIVRFHPQVSLVKDEKTATSNRTRKTRYPFPTKDCQVIQGSLEEPNFSIVEEMTRMIETMRMFEVYQKTMQFFDQQMPRSVASLEIYNAEVSFSIPG